MMRRTPTTAASRHGLVITVISLALAVVVAAMASLNVALPDIAQDTHASQTDLVWVIDAYSLAAVGVALLLAGRARGGLAHEYQYPPVAAAAGSPTHPAKTA
jgi:MFS family permease